MEEKLTVNMEEKLTVNRDLPILVNELKSIASKWKAFGLQLPGMTQSELDSVKQPSDKDTLREMLASWLRNESNPTRKAIVNALSSVGESRLADELYTTNKVSMMARAERGGAGGESQATPFSVYFRFTQGKGYGKLLWQDLGVPIRLQYRNDVLVSGFTGQLQNGSNLAPLRGVRRSP